MLVIELLHKVAFRTGLANSLFCPSHLVGKHTSELLQSFVAANMRADNAAVVGVGIPHDCLVAYAQSLALKAGQAGPVAPSKVHNGEVRVDTSSPLAYVAVAAPGASLVDTKAMVTFALLQRALGTGRRVFFLIQCIGLKQIVSLYRYPSEIWFRGRIQTKPSCVGCWCSFIPEFELL
jgi:ubiquinol-cytochrome c reductase core subunit 2